MNPQVNLDLGLFTAWELLPILPPAAFNGKEKAT